MAPTEPETEPAADALAAWFDWISRPPGRIVNQVARLMRAHGLSQRELSRRSGVSTRAVSEIARGLTCRYDQATLIKLCHAFNCGVGDLLVYEREADTTGLRPAGAATAPPRTPPLPPLPPALAKRL